MSQVKIGATDSGRTVQVNAGDTVVIELAENIATGYGWEFEELPAGPVALVESTSQAPERAMMGAPGRRVIRLQARSSGVAVVTLRLRRPWEPPTESADRFEIRVTVS